MNKEQHLIADIPVKAIIESGNKILLVLGADNIWELPGGRINEGEEINQALKRELKEELDLDIEIKNLLSVFKFTSISGKNHLVVIYECLAKNIEDLKIIDNEIKDLKWTGKDEFENLPMRQYKDILRRYFKDKL